MDRGYDVVHKVIGRAEVGRLVDRLSDRPRRVLHIEYADSLDVSPGLRLSVV
jgi:hypothetical protein